MADPIIIIILKYRDHPSILAIREVCKEKSDSPFLFTGMDKEEILRKILHFDVSKAYQDTDVPTKILKENAEPCSRKGKENVKIIIEKLVFCQMFLRHLKESFSGKYGMYGCLRFQVSMWI